MAMLHHAHSETSSSTSSSPSLWARPGTSLAPSLCTSQGASPAPAALAAAPAQSSSHDDAFIDASAGDGIPMDNNTQGIEEAYAVCLFLQPSNGSSLWDAMEQTRQMHPSWSVESATHFVDRSIQNYCPERAPTP